MDNTNSTPAVTASKAKSSTGLKIATIICAVLAVTGCSAAVYLFINRGSEGDKSSVAKNNKEGEGVNCYADDSGGDNNSGKTKADARYIYLDGYDYALKIPDTLTYLSFDYDQFNLGDSNSTFEGNYSTLSVNAALTGINHQARPEFIENGAEGDDYMTLGVITIGKINPEYEGSNNLGQPVLTGVGSDGSRNIYYGHPQAAFSKEEWQLDWEKKTVSEIEKWLTNKENYIKLK